MTNASCPQCPVQASHPAAQPALVRLEADGKTWTMLTEPAPVHLIALFRDPGISNSRSVSVVLDLQRNSDGSLVAGKACWLGPFLKALPGLPPGLVVALDNGVRCPYPQRAGNYTERVRLCVGQTQQWMTALTHPDGEKPGLLLCDKDLACAYAELGLLYHQNGAIWQCPSRFVEAVGNIAVFGSGMAVYEAMILAHPVLFSRQYANVYIKAFQGTVPRIEKLARLQRDKPESGV